MWGKILKPKITVNQIIESLDLVKVQLKANYIKEAKSMLKSIVNDMNTYQVTKTKGV